MKTAVVIPARYESTRFPGKPLIPIEGMSLIQRTYQQARLCPIVDIIVIATDDERIGEHVSQFGGNVCMTDKTCQTGTDRVGQAVKTASILIDSDIIINVQGDEPCIAPETIENVAQLLQSDPSIDIATAVCPIASDEELFSQHCVKCALSASGRALYFSRKPIAASRHIGIYGFRKKSLQQFLQAPPSPLQQREDIEILRALENDMTVGACFIAEHAPGVDTPEDISLVTRWLKRR